MYFDAKACGKRIQDLREELKLSQDSFSEQLHISRSHLSKIEVGINSPSLDLLIDLSIRCNVSLDFLVLGNDTNRNRIQSHIRMAIEELSKAEKLLS